MVSGLSLKSKVPISKLGFVSIDCESSYSSYQVLQVHMHSLQWEGGGDDPKAGAWCGGRFTPGYTKFDSQQKSKVPRHRDLNNSSDQEEALVPHG